MGNATRFYADTVLARKMRARTLEELEFRDLPQYDESVHFLVGPLPKNMRQLHAVRLQLERQLSGNNLDADERIDTELLTELIERKWMVEARHWFRRDARRGPLAVCAGGLLVIWKGKTETRLD